MKFQYFAYKSIDIIGKTIRKNPRQQIVLFPMFNPIHKSRLHFFVFGVERIKVGIYDGTFMAFVSLTLLIISIFRGKSIFEKLNKL